MDDIRITYGNRIRTLRKALKISQESLDLRAGLDRTYVASVENGKRNISLINIEKLAIALECSLSDFFDSSEFKVITPATLGRVADKAVKYYK